MDVGDTGRGNGGVSNVERCPVYCGKATASDCGNSNGHGGSCGVGGGDCSGSLSTHTARNPSFRHIPQLGFGSTVTLAAATC